MAAINEPEIELWDVDRVEIAGKRQDDGSVEALDRSMPDWPRHISVSSVSFEFEDSEDKDEVGGLTIAWYVPVG